MVHAAKRQQSASCESQHESDAGYADRVSRRAFWKAPTNPIHEECGLDDFSSREIPKEVPFNNKQRPWRQ